MFIFMFEETAITFGEECTASQTQQTILQNTVLSHLERGTHLASIFVL